MDFTVKESIRIGLAMIIVSILVLFATNFAKASYTIKNTKEWTDSFRTDMQLQSLIFMFNNNGTQEAIDSGVELKTVKGTDIIDLILKYNKLYVYDVDGFEYSWKTEYELNEQNEDGKKIWSQKYLTNNILGNNTEAEFYSYVTGVEMGVPIFHFKEKH